MQVEPLVLGVFALVAVHFGTLVPTLKTAGAVTAAAGGEECAAELSPVCACNCSFSATCQIDWSSFGLWPLILAAAVVGTFGVTLGFCCGVCARPLFDGKTSERVKAGKGVLNYPALQQ